MSNRQGKPYAGTRLAKYIEKRVLELRPKKTQEPLPARPASSIPTCSP